MARSATNTDTQQTTHTDTHRQIYWHTYVLTEPGLRAGREGDCMFYVPALDQHYLSHSNSQSVTMISLSQHTLPYGYTASLSKSVLMDLLDMSIIGHTHNRLHVV